MSLEGINTIIGFKSDAFILLLHIKLMASKVFRAKRVLTKRLWKLLIHSVDGSNNTD